MLIDFKINNYKSFMEEGNFSMLAAPKQQGLNYSLFTKQINSTNLKILSTSVVYGPNASGKTNIIGAMDTFRSIILRGHIRNDDEKDSPNTASTNLELIPNTSFIDPKPVEFFVDFLEKNLRIQYTLKLDLGVFLSTDYKRKVEFEELIVNGKTIFTRSNELKIGDVSTIKKHLTESVLSNISGATQIATSSLNEEDLFLTNGFKLIFSSNLANLVINWFANKFMVIYRADSVNFIKRFSDPKKKTIYVEKTTNNAAKLFGINSNAIGYVFDEDDSEVKLCSIFENKKTGNGISAISADIFESYGTLRFVNIFPLVIRAIKTGSTLVIDEFDASIHPIALMNIINIFHNDDINVNHAQLIFNTHNPIFLNSNLFRRDEIKFVERDESNHNSLIYSLSDFGTSGENGVRLHEDYMRNYFISRYGAIRDIDFSPIFEDIMKESSEEE